MKLKVGMDIGTGYTAYALVGVAENSSEESRIISAGVSRMNYGGFTVKGKAGGAVSPVTAYGEGNSVSRTETRRKYRSARIGKERRNMRRAQIVEDLKEAGVLGKDFSLSDVSERETHATMRARAEAVSRKLSPGELVAVLENINKARGYKSNRKARKDEGEAPDFKTQSDVCDRIRSEGITPGCIMKEYEDAGGECDIVFFKSDLMDEYNRIWEEQSKHWPFLTDELKGVLLKKSEKGVFDTCAPGKDSDNRFAWTWDGGKTLADGSKVKSAPAAWRVEALHGRIEPEKLVAVFQKVVLDIRKCNGYINRINERSRALKETGMTPGQMKWSVVEKDATASTKDMVFHRSDLMEEYDRIMEEQSRHYRGLDLASVKRIRDDLFLQRPLKSQKSKVSLCNYEKGRIETARDGKPVEIETGCRACPKSSPAFQMYKVVQTVNNIRVTQTVEEPDASGKTAMRIAERGLSDGVRAKLVFELTYREEMKDSDIVKTLFGKNSGARVNYEKVQGNLTQAAMFKAFKKIALSLSGKPGIRSTDTRKALDAVKSALSESFINPGVLDFNPLLEGAEFTGQPSYALWHLLYSYTEDGSPSGVESLISMLFTRFGFPESAARVLCGVKFADGYGGVSAKAIRKMMPYMLDGENQVVAAHRAGYNVLPPSLANGCTVKRGYVKPVERGSLCNPVAESCLNSGIHIINEIIREHGRVDSVCIEYARELLKSGKARKAEHERNKENEKKRKAARERIAGDFGIPDPKESDVTKYLLYEELKANGYRGLYSDRVIKPSDLFDGGVCTVEHIIPLSKSDDNSYSNKTVEFADINMDKGSMCPVDYIDIRQGGDGVAEYTGRVMKLYRKGAISKRKCENLLMRNSELYPEPGGRELADTARVARMMRELVSEVVPEVLVTSGGVTATLRRDWGVDEIRRTRLMDMYRRLGMVKTVDGEERVFYDDKHDDVINHALDAIVVAFTGNRHIQYINCANKHSAGGGGSFRFDPETVDLSAVDRSNLPAAILGIERSITEKADGRLRVSTPYDRERFAEDVARHAGRVIVRYKPGRDALKSSVNITKTGRKDGSSWKPGLNRRITGQPREGFCEDSILSDPKPVYGTKEVSVGGSMDADTIRSVVDKRYRKALMKRYEEFGRDAKKAFTGKNSPSRNNICYREGGELKIVPKKVWVRTVRYVHTIRKPLSSLAPRETDTVDIGKIYDPFSRELLRKRIEMFGGNAHKALSGLDENPIWYDKAHRYRMESVTVVALGYNGEPETLPDGSLSYNGLKCAAMVDKRDCRGNVVTDADGKPVRSGYRKFGANSHIELYRVPKAKDGKPAYEFSEKVVPVYEAVRRRVMGMASVNGGYRRDEGWEYVMSLRRNETFVFPEYDGDGNLVFDPKAHGIDWYRNPENRDIYVPNMFRVQKLSESNYVFRHVSDNNLGNFNTELRNIRWKTCRPNSKNPAERVDLAVKVRVDALGNVAEILS